MLVRQFNRVARSSRLFNTGVWNLHQYSTSNTGGGKDTSGANKACDCDVTPTMYDCRKYGHNLPANNVMPPFDALYNIPTGVFRCTAGEMFGAVNYYGALCYQNPEYFSFHHMTYYDMHMYLRQYRKPSPNTGRKK